MKKIISGLKSYNIILKECKKEIISSIVISLIIIILSIVSPALIARIVTFVISGKYTKIIFIIIFLVLIKLLHIILSLLDSKIFLSFKKKLIVKLKEEIANSIINFDLNYFLENGKGKFIQRINTDPQTISDAMLNMKNYMVVLVTNVGTIFYILYLDIISGIIYFVTLFLIIMFRYIGIKRKRYYLKLNALAKEKNNNLLTDSYNGIKDIKEFNLKEIFNTRTSKDFNNIENLQYKADFNYNFFYILSSLIEWSGTAIFIMVGVYCVSINKLNLDSFITIFMYRNIVFSFAACLSLFVDSVSVFGLSSSRVFEIIESKNNISNEELIDNVNCKGNIEFRNVTFRYDEKNVLKDCSFSIKHNGLYSLVGKSGVGKTTIGNLLMRLYKVNSGEILLDNVNINDYSLEYLRRNISIISQNYYLFDMSIKDNLLLVKPSLTDNEIVSICKKVGLHSDIVNFENGYDTIIGEGGCNISGGQRKRLAIARALVLNSKVIIFDEATSSLDTDLEKQIYLLANKLKKNHVIIFISHNMNLVKGTDNIFVLEKGGNICFGNHAFLLKNSKAYNKLVNNIT